MKNAILYSILASMIFFSCKKDHGSNPSNKTYSVKLNVAGFIQEISKSINGIRVNSLGTTSIPATNYLTELHYIAFNSSGKKISYLAQDSSSTNFGHISDNLPAGTYTIVVAAGKSGFHAVVPSVDALTTSYFTYDITTAPYRVPWKDSFLKKFQITVPQSDSSQTVNLNRIVGQLEINIDDAIPATASTLSIVLNPEYTQYNIDKASPNKQAQTIALTFSIPASVRGTKNFQAYVFVLNTATTFKTTISCYDASQKLLGTAAATDVTCQAGKRTLLSGNLFGSDNAFNISINNDWGSSPISVPF